MTKRLDEAYQFYGEVVADNRRMQVDWFAANVLQSPIEAGMAQALLIMNTGFGWEFMEDMIEFVPGFHPVGPAVQIIPQYTIGKYKADFAIFFKRPDSSVGKIVVECDGHEFHEKTKAQASYDKARDRFMQMEGFQVFRFSGSEIFTNPKRCADEVGEAIYRSIYPKGED